MGSNCPSNRNERSYSGTMALKGWKPQRLTENITTWLNISSIWIISLSKIQLIRTYIPESITNTPMLNPESIQGFGRIGKLVLQTTLHKTNPGIHLLSAHIFLTILCISGTGKGQERLIWTPGTTSKQTYLIIPLEAPNTCLWIWWTKWYQIQVYNR